MAKIINFPVIKNGPGPIKPIGGAAAARKQITTQAIGRAA